MTQHQESPVDLPSHDRPDKAGALGWTTVTIATAALLLAATNAVAISGWAAELTPSPLNARIVAASDNWSAATRSAGLGAPRAWLHARWEAAQALRFGSSGKDRDQR